MSEFTDMQRAQRNRRCPFCYGAITVRSSYLRGWHLSCWDHPEDHVITRIDECPTVFDLNKLRREAEDITRPQRIAGRSVAQDMADLFG